MDWVIAPATRADADRLALVAAATFLETFAGVLDGDAIIAHCAREHTGHAYQALLAAGATAWIARAGAGGAPIGYAIVSRPDLPGIDPDGGDLELKRIYLLSRFHGTGLGAALMEAATAHAGARGAARLLLGVYAGNARAIAFYRKAGFVPFGERRFRVGDRHYDDLMLARPLPPA